MADSIHKQLMRMKRRVMRDGNMSPGLADTMTTQHDIGKAVKKLLNTTAVHFGFDDYVHVCKSCGRDACLAYLDRCIDIDDGVPTEGLV